MTRRAGAAPPEPPVLRSSAGRGWRGLRAELVRLSPGRSEAAPSAWHRLGFHVGRPVWAGCRVGDIMSRRLQVAGEADLVPAGADGAWTDDDACSVLRLHLDPAWLARVHETDVALALPPRLQLRDARLLRLAQMLRAEIEMEGPSDLLFIDGLAHALAARLVALAGEPSEGPQPATTFNAVQRRRLVDFIEAHLERPLRLTELAQQTAAGLTQFKALFAATFAMPPHQYVLARRLERAHDMLLHSSATVSEIAAATGFADQSHLTRRLRRAFGLTPAVLRQRRTQTADRLFQGAAEPTRRAPSPAPR